MKYSLYSNPAFKVYAVVEDGYVRIKTEGFASPILKPIVSNMLGFFDGAKPAKVEDDHLIFSTWMPPIPSNAFSRLVSSQINAHFGRDTPEQVTISITEECPNKCVHCALPDTNNKKSLEPDKIKDVIDQCLQLGSTFIIFDGGEPLVYSGLEDLIQYVDSARAITGLFTSGVGLSKQRACDLKEAGLDMLTVSLDSAKEHNHDLMRGRKGVFEEAMSAIRNSLEAGLLVNIYVVLTKRNIDELYDFYELAYDMGVHELSFFEVVPTGRWIDHESETLSHLDYEKFDRFVKHADTIKGPRIFSVPHILEITGCFAGKKWLHVTPEGDVYPCACMPLPYGNIYKNSLKDVWDGLQKEKIFDANYCLMRNSEFREKYLGLSKPEK
ncbi:MAG: radical SAM/SPASM domain-containing protein [Methanohalobium sp.]|uniref:radical SAM/SPASM domain-containing protein n=1 Tax=Methanohalobium sp. TaxID=2837493 RepID=UPI003979C5F3